MKTKVTWKEVAMALWRLVNAKQHRIRVLVNREHLKRLESLASPVTENKQEDEFWERVEKEVEEQTQPVNQEEKVK